MQTQEKFRGPAYKTFKIPPQGQIKGFNKNLPIILMAMSSYRPRFSNIFKI